MTSIRAASSSSARPWSAYSSVKRFSAPFKDEVSWSFSLVIWTMLCSLFSNRTSSYRLRKLNRLTLKIREEACLFLEFCLLFELRR